MLLVTSWMAMLFVGVAGGGAVHLLLAGAAAVFPWKAIAAGPRVGGDGEEEAP